MRRDAVVSVRRFLHNSPAGPVPERVRNARDPRVTTLRLADRHRAVAVRQRDVYWLVTILPDAEAYTYAQRHRFTVNSAIGVIQVWDAEALARVEPALRRSAAGSAKRLYGHICETDLIDIGIDQELLLPMVRMMATDAHLAAVEPLLPESQYAPSRSLARGGSLTDALARARRLPGDLGRERRRRRPGGALQRSPARPPSPATGSSSTGC